MTMYVDKTNLDILSLPRLLRLRQAVMAKGVDPTSEQLDILNAAVLDESAAGDVATGKAVLNGTIYQRAYRDYTLEERQTMAKAECARRILAVADQTAQLNLAAAAAGGALDPIQLATYQSGVAWIAAMRSQWLIIADNALDPKDNANWPSVPAGVAELGAAF